MRALSILGISAGIASPLASQVTRRARTDSTVVVRMLRPGGEARLLFQIDSLKRALDREPLGAADHEALKVEVEKLLSALTELARSSGELGANVGTIVARAMAEGAARGGFRQFQFLPRGWIGIDAEGVPRVHRIFGDNEIVRYFDYPSIVSVEPNSPAQRAGINAGDVLVAYDGADVREREINLSRLLVPERRLTVTVRRDGETKDFEVTVGKAPSDFVRQQFGLNQVFVDSAFARTLTAPGSPAMIHVMPSTRMAPRELPPEGPVARGGIMVLPSPRMAGWPLWGAQLSTLSGGLARTVGVGSGVLVIDVAEPTPASQSGLQEGDIIVKAAGRPVASVSELQRITVDHEAERVVELEVLRGKKPVKVTLHWGSGR